MRLSAALLLDGVGRRLHGPGLAGDRLARHDLTLHQLALLVILQQL